MTPKKDQLQTFQIKKKTTRHIVKITKSKTNAFRKEIIQYFDANGFLSWSSKEKKYASINSNKDSKACN